jgi:Flp pilus assembly protein TadD
LERPQQRAIEENKTMGGATANGTARGATSRERESIDDAEALDQFKQGLVQLQKGFAREAVVKLRSAVARQPRNAYFVSYFGLATGIAQKKWREAETLCIQALQLKRTAPQLYLNLANVYEFSGRVGEAVETLCEGMRYTGRDSRIAAALRAFGVRRPPVLSFLSRENTLNRCLGKIRHAKKKSRGW